MIKEQLLSFIQDALAACGQEDGFSDGQHVFLVDICLKGASSVNKVEVLVDTDTGVSIAECLSVNRYLNSALEMDEEMKRLVGDGYDLTVSSPGIGAPIKHVRQYVRHTGHLLRVQYSVGDRPVREISGRLLRAEVLDVAEPFIILEPVAAGKKKKGEALEPMQLELSGIKRAVVEVEF